MRFLHLLALLKKIMSLITIKGFGMGVNSLMSKAFLAPAFMVLLAMLASCMEENKTDGSRSGSRTGHRTANSESN